MTRLRLFPLVLTGLVGLLLTVPAFATATYPPTIQAELGLAEAPQCTLCHRDNNGGATTVVRPFGRLMMSHFGLTGGGNVALLKEAIAGDDAEHLDTDGDGVPDIDELRAGSDPNVGLSGQEAAPDVPLPETGCNFASRAPAGSATLTAFVLAAFALWRRRSR